MGSNGTLVRLSVAELAWIRHAHRQDDLAAWLARDDIDGYALEAAHAGVHFLLSGEAGEAPLGFMHDASFGEPVAASMARVLTPELVTTVADAVESMSVRDLRRRLASDTLATITPFTQALGDDDKEWLLAVLQGLMTFMRDAARDGAHVLVVIR